MKLIAVIFLCDIQLGGPSWSVTFGRRDSTTASLSAANSDIPLPTSSLSDLISSFASKGFTTNEMVALSGKLLLYIIKMGQWDMMICKEYYQIFAIN